MHRKNFIKSGMLISTGLTLGVNHLKGEQENHFSLDEIKEFVFAAHKDLELTRKIVEQKPLILNCTNQAKRGDFETALGGASHMGRRDIADILVERGARMDIFSMTFLGHLNFVRNMIEMSPQYLMASGPHGFSLLHHAKVGKHDEFAKWLQDQGLDTEFFENAF